MYTAITLVVAVLLSLVVLGLLLTGIKLAKQDIHLTEIAPDTGKIIVEAGKPVRFLFNSPDGHYDENGVFVTGRQDFGVLYDATGRVFYGITPIREVFKFDVSWTEFAEGGYDETGKARPPTVEEKTERVTTFKRFYTHAVLIRGAEMAKESVVADSNDTSTTRIDAVLLVTIKITDIKKALYKIPPEGIVFAQADTAIEGAFNDYVRGRRWESFREEPKLAQGEKFVQHIITAANPVLAASALDIGMEVTVVELKYYDLTASPENEALAASQTLLLVAQNEGAAEVARATLHKQARGIEGEGDADYLKKIAVEVGLNHAAEIVKLGAVAKTQLRVYGSTTNAVPLIDTGDGK